MNNFLYIVTINNLGNCNSKLIFTKWQQTYKLELRVLPILMYSMCMERIYINNNLPSTMNLVMMSIDSKTMYETLGRLSSDELHSIIPSYIRSIIMTSQFPKLRHIFWGCHDLVPATRPPIEFDQAP